MKHSFRNITWRFHDCRSRYPGLPTDKVYLHDPADVFKNFNILFTGQVRERFIVFWLDSANRVMGFEIVSEGILNSSLVHPREVYRGAIVATCASVIVAHNHPSGNTQPSMEDLRVTKQIADAGKIIGIPVHDHIIFTDNGFLSFAEQGLI